MTLSWTFLLLSILIYVFAIFGMNFITVDLQLPLDHPYNIAAYENFRELPDATLQRSYVKPPKSFTVVIF